MAGLTSTGITIKSVDEILDDIESDELATIDPNLNTQADGVLGQLNGIYAAALAECWELLEEIYQSAYPDTASGQSLSYVAALTGAIRREATKAELAVSLGGVANQVIPAGIRAYAFEDPESEFVLDADVTLSGAGFGTGTMTAVTPGSRTTAADLEAMTIITPDANLNSITTAASNALTPGLDEETDTQLRQRREQTLALPGASTVEAIRADMLQVRGVDSCTVFENPTGVTDANGVPPYAIEVLVYSEAAPNYTAQDVADQIWASKPAGTQTHGGEGPVTVTDSLGNQHDIYYSEPTTAELWIDLALRPTTDGTYVGDAAVKAALEQWALNLRVGESVYASDIIRVVAGLTGVEYVVAPAFVDAAPSPSPSTSWTATARQLGLIDAARIAVVQI